MSLTTPASNASVLVHVVAIFSLDRPTEAVSLTKSLDATIAEIVEDVVRQLGVSGESERWVVLREFVPLDHSRTLRQLADDREFRLVLLSDRTYHRLRGSAPSFSDREVEKEKQATFDHLAPPPSIAPGAPPRMPAPAPLPPQAPPRVMPPMPPPSIAPSAPPRMPAPAPLPPQAPARGMPPMPPPSIAPGASAPPPPPAAVPMPQPSPRRRSAERDAMTVESAAEERRASVRYYTRMNPWTTFPLLVSISRETLREVAIQNVGQASSDGFDTRAGDVIEVEPILPGCTCYPPRAVVRIVPGDIDVHFAVVPQVLGKLLEPRVLLRRNGVVVAAVPLSIVVKKPTLAAIVGVCSMVVPFGLSVLKKFKIDVEAQVDNGLNVYGRLAALALRDHAPEAVAVLLLFVAGWLYLKTRPKRGDAFFPITSLAVVP